MTYRSGSAESARSNQALLSSSQENESPGGMRWSPALSEAGSELTSEARSKRRDEIESGTGGRGSVDSLGLYVDVDANDVDRRGRDIGVEGREFL